jgi:hypothetical protein
MFVSPAACGLNGPKYFVAPRPTGQIDPATAGAGASTRSRRRHPGVLRTIAGVIATRIASARGVSAASLRALTSCAASELAGELKDSRRV